MKEVKKITLLLIFVGMLSLTTAQYVTAACSGTQVWSGIITSANNAIDQDVILGSSLITIDNDGVHITADTCDIAVTMTGDVVIDTMGTSELYLEVADGHTITFYLTNNLTFEGPLLIVARGAGTIIFNMLGGQSLTLSPSNDTDSRSGVQFFVCMQNELGVLFNREMSSSTNLDVNVNVGTHCLISYLAQDAPQISTEVGLIRWNPSNGDVGRMVVNVADRGGVIIRGCQTDSISSPTLMLTDIYYGIPAGLDAVMQVENTLSSTVASGLLVVNSNATWPELLVDPFLDLGARSDTTNYSGLFTGTQYGFILGANATFTVLENAYLDYVGLTGTVCPGVAGLDSGHVKARTPSAFIVDGNNNPLSTPARIFLANQSAIYLRSGVDVVGNVQPQGSAHPFTVDPLLRACGAGYTVFDIEGQLNMYGANTSDISPNGLQSMIEILSLEVDPTGGPLFVGTTETNFPLRTFAQSPAGYYYQYNAANILINNNWNMYNAALKHSDTIHKVIEKNDTTSEPTYIGGDTAELLGPDTSKPRLSFYNSVFLLHTSVAVTGFDIFVPNGLDPATGACINNYSAFYYFQNGWAIDNGTGRQMVLGTYVGSTACDGCSVICRNTYLDVAQTTTCNGGAGLVQELDLRVQANNDTIDNQITGDITGENAINTIYLGGVSNISVGTYGTTGTDQQGNSFALTTFPLLLVDGNYFSFETRGGTVGLPSTSNVTGQGGIFVDTNGTFSLGMGVLAYFGTMITKSANGIIDVPKRCSLFSSCVGVAEWNVNLAQTQVLVPAGTNVSDYTINWMFVKKDYAGGFIPYQNSCSSSLCPAATNNNIFNIPTIAGTVDQLQVAGSRLGDRAHIYIDGGIVREFVPCVGFNSAEAAVAVIVLNNNGTVGLGGLNRNGDSSRANTRVGANGVTIIAEGNGTVVLNTDIIIDNNCAIVPGPNFDPSSNILMISSEESRSVVVTAGTTLDLSGLAVIFTGNVNLVVETGANIIFGLGNSLAATNLGFIDNASLVLAPVPNVLDSDLPLSYIDILQSILDTPLCSFTQNGTSRTTFMGTGQLNFANKASMSIPRGVTLGIETDIDLGIFTTALTMQLQDSAQVHIGNSRANSFGGALQIGNLTPQLDASITFSLVLNGSGARFSVGAQGFLGLAVGAMCKQPSAPNNWLVAPLSNVANLNLTLIDGTFSHAHIWEGSDEFASLVAMSSGLGTAVTYSISVSPITYANGLSRTSILGGGNIVNIVGTAGSINPVVMDDDASFGNYSASILASRINLANSVSGQNAVNVFNFLKLKDISTAQPVIGQGVGAQNQRNHSVLNAAWIHANKIGRESFENIVCTSGKLTAQQHIMQTGAVSLGVDLTTAPGTLLNVVDIP